jgi:hypothetical protein
MARVTATSFLESFVLPLVTGGAVAVGRPVTPADHDRLRMELDRATVALVAVDEARAAVLSTVCAQPPPLLFADDDLALMVGLHNTLVLAHPDADGALVTDGQRRRIAGGALIAVSQPLTRDRTCALARHGLLHNLHQLGRSDTLVSWWTGKAHFVGQTPPARLLAWSGVRRVRQDVTRASFADLLTAPDVTAITAALMRRSPITALIAPPVNGPPLHWEDAVFLLRDAELARAIAYATLTAPSGEIAAIARLAASFEQLVERTPAVADVRAVAGFLVHLAGLQLLGATDDKHTALALALAPGHARPRGLVTYAALPAALAAIAPELAVPLGIDGEPVWSRRWDVERALVGDALGDAVIAGVADRLARHLIRSPATVAVDQ